MNKAVQLRKCSRPLRALIAFKRFHVKKLNEQLAKLLEVHTMAGARGRTANSREKVQGRVEQLECELKASARLQGAPLRDKVSTLVGTRCASLLCPCTLTFDLIEQLF
jgi:hypothetical protein